MTRPVKHYTRVFKAIADGCETSGEVAEATGIGRHHVRNLLRQMISDGGIAREAKPSFWDVASYRSCFRYHVPGARP